MLTPNYINNEIPKRMVELMGEIEADMLRRVAYYISRYNRVTGTAEFLSLKQTQYNLLYDDLLKIISEYSGLAEREIRAIYEQSAIKSIDYDNRIISAARGANYALPAASTATAAAMQQTLEAAIARAIDIQNLTNTRCLQSALDAFTRATDRAYLSIATGADTFDNAYKQAVDELAKSGLTVAEYNRNGKTINYSIEAATRRNLITSIGQLTGEIQLQNLAMLGCHLVQTTSHAGARPTHAVWQGKVFWVGTQERGYGSLVDDCGYGQPDGIKGVNCYHDFFPYLEGAPLAFDRDPAKNQLGIDNDELYELTQKQRYLERKVREAKKAQRVYDGAGMTTEAQNAARLVRERQAAVREFLEQHPLLRRDYTRERVAQ